MYSDSYVLFETSDERYKFLCNATVIGKGQNMPVEGGGPREDTAERLISEVSKLINL